MLVRSGGPPSEPALAGADVLEVLEEAIGRGLVAMGAREASPPSTEPATRLRPDKLSVIDGIFDDDDDAPRTLVQHGRPPAHRSGIVMTPRREEMERRMLTVPEAMLSLPKASAVLAGWTPADGVQARKPPVAMGTTITRIKRMPWADAPAARPQVAFEAGAYAPAPVPSPHVPPAPVLRATLLLPSAHRPAPPPPLPAQPGPNFGPTPVTAVPMQAIHHPPRQAWPATPPAAMTVAASSTVRRPVVASRGRSRAPLAILVMAVVIGIGIGVDQPARSSTRAVLVAQSKRIAARAVGLHDRLRPRP